MKNTRYDKRNCMFTPMEALGQYVEVALAIHFAASAICALTPTQKDDNILGKIYKVIEFFALAIGKAKDR